MASAAGVAQPSATAPKNAPCIEQFHASVKAIVPNASFIPFLQKTREKDTRSRSRVGLGEKTAANQNKKPHRYADNRYERIVLFGLAFIWTGSLQAWLTMLTGVHDEPQKKQNSQRPLRPTPHCRKIHSITPICESRHLAITLIPVYARGMLTLLAPIVGEKLAKPAFFALLALLLLGAGFTLSRCGHDNAREEAQAEQSTRSSEAYSNAVAFGVSTLDNRAVTESALAEATAVVKDEIGNAASLTEIRSSLVTQLCQRPEHKGDAACVR